MYKLIFSSLLLLVAGMAFDNYELPKNWHKSGSDPGKYEMGIDKGAAKDGGNAATIKSIDKDISGFGTLMQSCSPAQYTGKRVRMSGLMRSRDVVQWAGFWMRVDQAGTQKPMTFDNMENRAVKGTTDWKRYEIVLDVPANAGNLAYGALVSGTGQIWFSDLKFEIVDPSVPSTNMMEEKGETLSAPSNLDFDK